MRVLELARVLAGPWAGQLLADFGADVIKVEREGVGDETRAWGPPFVSAADGGHLDAAYFHAANRGKRSIALDLASETGRETVRALAASADVLIENFKVGDLRKFGLAPGDLAKSFPHLIVCSVTGFGQTGPYAHRAGYDFVVQGMGGFMSLTGEPDGTPQKAGIAYADLFTGVYAVSAILAALHAREATGRGAHIDMSLLDTQIGVLANQALNYFVTGRDPARAGNAHVNLVPYQVFHASDGWIVIAVGNDGQFAKLCGVLGASELAADARFATNPARVRNREILEPLLAANVASRQRDALLMALEAVGVPAGPVNTLSQAFDDPQVEHRQMRLSLPNDLAADGTVPGLRNPVMLNGKPCIAQGASPALGAHNPSVLAALAAGMDPWRQERWREPGRAPAPPG